MWFTCIPTLPDKYGKFWGWLLISLAHTNLYGNVMYPPRLHILFSLESLPADPLSLKPDSSIVSLGQLPTFGVSSKTGSFGVKLASANTYDLDAYLWLWGSGNPSTRGVPYSKLLCVTLAINYCDKTTAIHVIIRIIIIKYRPRKFVRKP